jgi:zinc protease
MSWSTFRRGRRLLAGGLFAIAVASSGTSAPALAAASAPSLREAYAAERYVLPNGLEVILHVDHRLPDVAVNVWYHVGSKDEAEGRSGFAHLFEHLMFQGSRNVAEDTFFKHLEQAGARHVNGTTNGDRTNYFETMPAHQLGLALWLESDRMATLLDHVNQETFESQRRVVLNEYRLGTETQPYGFLWETLAASSYPEGHPYHHTTIGTPKDLEAASLADVKAFFRTFYVPNNATLVLAGDFEVAEAKALVQKYFGAIPRGEAPPTRTTAMPVTRNHEERVTMEANVALPRLAIQWPTPAFATLDDAKLDVVGVLLGSGRASRGQSRLVYDQRLAQSFFAYQGSGKLASTFAVDVTVQRGKDPERALAEVDRLLAELAKNGPTDAELERVKRELTTGAWRNVESLSNRADTLNLYNDLTHDPGFAATVVDRYQAVTRDDVRQAVAQYLTRDHRLIVVVKPNPAAPVAGHVVATAGKVQ